MNTEKHIDMIEKRCNELEDKKRNKSECELIEQNNNKTFKFIQDEISDISDTITKNRENLIEVKSLLLNQSEAMGALKDDVEKLKWFKLETIRRFILIVIGSAIALLIPFLISKLYPLLLLILEFLTETGV